MLVTPYTQQEAENNLEKRLLNLRHCGLRAECTEQIFCMWSKRFPIIKSMRNHYKYSLEIFMATAVLHNLAVLWNEPLCWNVAEPNDDGDEEPNAEEDDGNEAVAGPITGDRTRIKLEGEALRNTLLHNMPVATTEENRRITQRV